MGELLSLRGVHKGYLRGGVNMPVLADVSLEVGGLRVVTGYGWPTHAALGRGAHPRGCTSLSLSPPPPTPHRVRRASVLATASDNRALGVRDAGRRALSAVRL
jgi:hypothetical protein